MNPQPQSNDTPTTCPRCQSSNPRRQRFCGSCGEALDPTPETISSIVEQQIKRELDARLKDQKVVAVEIAESVYERVSRWAKIFVVLLTLPLGAAVYLIHGQYASLSDLVKSSRSEAERILAGATTRARAVEEMVDAANKKTKALDALLEGRSKSLAELDSKVTVAQQKLIGYEGKMQEYEARISRSGSEALSQVDSLKQNSNKALSEIGQLQLAVSRQQKELTETGALVRDLASRSLIEGFRSVPPSPNFVIVTRTNTSHTVCMRLTQVPYRGTVRVQWNMAVQPLDSYMVVGNVVVLPYWEDTIDKFSDRLIFVSYLADTNPPPGTPYYKALSLKGDVVYGDGLVVVPPFPPRAR